MMVVVPFAPKIRTQLVKLFIDEPTTLEQLDILLVAFLGRERILLANVANKRFANCLTQRDTSVKMSIAKEVDAFG
jgi:hypothetical protein